MMTEELISSPFPISFKTDLARRKAIWVNQNTLLWNIAASEWDRYCLFYSPDGVQSGSELALTFSPEGPGGNVFEKNPYIRDWAAFKIAADDFERLPALVKGQVGMIARDGRDRIIDVTGVQMAGALDALFAYDGPLGVTFEGGIPTLRVWAPTAQSVRLHLFDDSSGEATQILKMDEDPHSGVWSLTGQAGWKGKYYLHEVRVYVPAVGELVTNLVTDPYSFSLSTNGLRSQIVDLRDSVLKPQGWDELLKPPLAAPEDSVIYELHVRDFSIRDQSVPEALRGTFKAFTVAESNGMRHLTGLARAGLTHIHLLPVFDIATINEDKRTWKSVDEAQLATYPPDSDQQAAAVLAIQAEDGFNWGYDPHHYTVPEGSYATDPDGTPRIREFREMVAGLNRAGLRVVMDVVYNHTTHSGQNRTSVLDKIVPGYYYRLDTEGQVETSTCCSNTATEHVMMAKLMVDSLLIWAREYKVDGFRFDLMGHHMLANMQAVRAALDGLTLAKDGVEGQAIYLYGEGWDFGEVANNARGLNAAQRNIGGSGIGAFNDRLRDGVRGGRPFGDPREQGFCTGLYFNPNAIEYRWPDDQRWVLLNYTDWIRLGLAGNLQDYPMVDSFGDLTDGARLLYNDAPAGYARDPQENVVYVAAHDNETLFDAVQAKSAASVDLAGRIRMNNLALSIVMFSQGIAFFHAGDDLLRSKSLDRNSYDSGDWFNKLDWTLTDNNWGVGLPPHSGDKQAVFRQLLSNPALKPTPADIANTAAIFREYLQIRKGSPLFRLRTADQVKRALTFLNACAYPIPGLIVMHLANIDGLDTNYSDLLVAFNAAPYEVSFADPAFTGKAYILHPILQSSVDPVVRTAAFDAEAGSFSIPGRSAAVFVVKM
jgi:pullulanase-type alpha-1,6-glucosidase